MRELVAEGCEHGYLTGDRIADALQDVELTPEQFETILKERGGFLLFSRLPASLPTGQDLQAYFAQVGVMKGKENVRIFETLDDALQWVEDRILAAEHAGPEAGAAPLALGQIELLRGFEAEQMLAALVPCVDELAYAPGERIFQSGDAGEELFLIRRGIVRIVLPIEGSKYHNLAAFGRGNFFGEVAFLDRGRRSADAVATTPTDLFVISRTKFDELSRAHPLVGLKIYARLARALALRLRHTDAEVRALYEA